MIWSKRKKALQGRLADSLKGRIQYHVTRYGPGNSYTMSRAWITFDKQELVNFSTVKWWLAHGELRTELQNLYKATDWRDPAQKEGYYLAYEQATEILHKQELFTREDFDAASQEFLNLSIGDAGKSKNPIIRALAMLDRRLGKRGLAQLEFRPTEREIVKSFYALRCRVEGIAQPQQFRKV